MPPNDYKPDEGKPPLMSAVLIPFRLTLLDLASMMRDMAAKHKLQGAEDPFQEWRQLPDAKARLADAGARHATNPWEVNHADGRWLHLLHAIWGFMAAYEKWKEEQGIRPAAIQGPAGADWREKQYHTVGPVPGCKCAMCLTWQPQLQVSGHYWTGDRGTWHCTCGAGRPDACTCDQSNGDHR